MKNNAPKPIPEVIDEFMNLTGCEELFLYGGSAIDRYLDPNCRVMDYDIAISNLEQYQNVIENLRTQGFDVGNPRLSHNLATVAKHPNYGIYDLSCMDIENNGIYNIEKFYIEYSKKYPKGKIVDTYHAVEGLREGRIEIANNPENEKAYNLLRRFSVLAGKYDINLTRGGINEDTMSIIENKLRQTPPGKHDEQERVRCLSRFLGAAFRRRKQAVYFKSIGKTGLYAYGFPALNQLMNDNKFIKSLQEAPATDKQNLINRMLAYAKDRDSLVDELSLLKKRERDREDIRVINKIEALDEEKTSKNRLNKSIIIPLLQFKQGKTTR